MQQFKLLSLAEQGCSVRNRRSAVANLDLLKNTDIFIQIPHTKKGLGIFQLSSPIHNK